MTAEERLRKYVENAKRIERNVPILKEEPKLNEFSNYMFQHCDDIEEILNRIEELKKIFNKDRIKPIGKMGFVQIKKLTDEEYMRIFELLGE